MKKIKSAAALIILLLVLVLIIGWYICFALQTLTLYQQRLPNMLIHAVVGIILTFFGILNLVGAGAEKLAK